MSHYAGHPGYSVVSWSSVQRLEMLLFSGVFQPYSGGIGGGRVTHCSATFRSDLVECCSQFIRRSVLDRVRTPPSYWLTREQMGTTCSRRLLSSDLSRAIACFGNHGAVGGKPTHNEHHDGLSGTTRCHTIYGTGSRSKNPVLGELFSPELENFAKAFLENPENLYTWH